MEIELAIYEDCLNLIDKFAESDDHSFKTFCQKWHDAMFQHVYAVQTTAIEVIQTTKTILHLAKRIVCAKHDLSKVELEQHNNQQLSRRFGGIFLMYATYFKQPTKQHVKVQMSNETWQDLTTFIESLSVNTTTDEVRYIFWNLYKEDAFRFTAFDCDLGLENLIDYDRLFDIHNGNKYVDVVRVKLKQKLMGVIEVEKVLPGMLSLEEQYNISKELLLDIDKPAAKTLPPTKIFNEIQDAINSIHIILEDDGDHDHDCSPPLKSNGTKKELKRKAAGYKTNDEDSPPEDNFQQEDIKKRFGRPTVRQIMTQELPESLTDDLKNYSNEDEDQKP